MSHLDLQEWMGRCSRISFKYDAIALLKHFVWSRLLFFLEIVSIYFWALEVIKRIYKQINVSEEHNAAHKMEMCSTKSTLLLYKSPFHSMKIQLFCLPCFVALRRCMWMTRTLLAGCQKSIWHHQSISRREARIVLDEGSTCLLYVRILWRSVQNMQLALHTGGI